LELFHLAASGVPGIGEKLNPSRLVMMPSSSIHLKTLKAPGQNNDNRLRRPRSDNCQYRRRNHPDNEPRTALLTYSKERP